MDGSGPRHVRTSVVGLCPHGAGFGHHPGSAGVTRTAAIGRILDLAEDASPVDAVESIARGLHEALGAHTVSFLIADVSQRGLVRLAHVAVDESADKVDDDGTSPDRVDHEELAVVLPLIAGGAAEQAIRTQTVQVLRPGRQLDGRPPSDQWTVLAPVTERGEVQGLLEMSLPEEPTPGVIDAISRSAHVLAFVIIANRRHTDLFEWGSRSTPFSLSAEIQRRLLPSAYTCEAGAFTLSGWLVAAADAGGDTFDYSLGRDVLHLSITDAMGHDVASSLAATLCVGSLRNSRRQAASLVEQATTASNALFEHGDHIGDEGFVTGILGRLDLNTACLELVNAGHVLPYLSRGDTVREIDLPVGLPFGMFGDTVYESTSIELQKGDRVVFLTDGLIERNGSSPENIIAQIGELGSLHAREATRQLTDIVLAGVGPTLDDDATVLIIDWGGDHELGRQSRGGSNISTSTLLRSRQRTADLRDTAADERDEVADSRDRVADARDATGDARDTGSAARDIDVHELLARALRRDAEAERRDLAADERDADAASRDSVSEGWGTDAEGRAAFLAAGTSGRGQSALDRVHGSEDRAASAADRADLIEALRRAVERSDAAAEQRDEGAIRRIRSEGDRVHAGLDRDHAADDRATAAIARATDD